MKRILLPLFTALTILTVPYTTLAAGISASGGTKKPVGQTFTVTVTASGTTFDSLQGTLNVSGPVSVVSVSPGNATWLPGKEPANGKQFVGLANATSSLVVARVTLKGTKEGSGSVSISGVKLAHKGTIVGTDGGSTSFTITKALVMPGAPKVTSSTHPDQSQSYEATTATFEWNKDNGVTDFSYVLDEADKTIPPAKPTASDTSKTYEGLALGAHYFHIRAKNSDGWGETTHYKITIKEPDAKVDETLEKATISKIEADPTFKTSLDDGTVTGIKLSGKAPIGFVVNLTFAPTLTLPEEKKLTAEVTEQGTWEYLIDFPIHAGFYKVTAQGQKEKTLTPASDTVLFEATLAQGGNIRILTAADKEKPAPIVKDQTNDSKVLSFVKSNAAIGGGALAALIALGFAAFFGLKKRNPDKKIDKFWK